MVNYWAALKRPFLSIKTLLLGVLLPLLPVVSWFANGYQMRCAQYGLHKNNEAPSWSNIVNLFVLGFFKSLINIIYALPLIIIFGFAFLKMAATVANQDFMAILSVAGLMRNMLILATIFFVVFIYVRPASLMSYASHNKFKEAFNFGYIFKIIIQREWFVTWVVVTLFTLVMWLLYYFVVFTLAVYLMNAATWVYFVMAVVNLWGMFIEQTIVMSMYGEGYGEAYNAIYEKQILKKKQLLFNRYA